MPYDVKLDVCAVDVWKLDICDAISKRLNDLSSIFGTNLVVIEEPKKVFFNC